MSWLDAVPSLLVATALLLLPGALLLLALGVRAPAAWATAPALSVAVLTVTAVLTQQFSLAWGPVPLAAGVVVGVVVGAGCRRVLPSAPPGTTHEVGRPRERWWWAGCWLAAAAIVVVRLCSAFGSPETFSQTHDNVFHLNALRYVLDTGHGSSLTLASLGTTGDRAFYPAAWHDLVALVAQLTDASIPVAMNAVDVAIAAFVWPLGCLSLAVATLGRRRSAYVSGALLSVAFGSFPFLPLSFGPIYPWMLATALLPALLGLLVTIVARPLVELPGLLVVLLAGLVGATCAHPALAVVALALAAPAVASALPRISSEGTRGRAAVVALAYVAVLLACWVYLRPARTANWDHVGQPGTAFARAVLLAPVGGPPSILALVAATTGVAVCLKGNRGSWPVALAVLAVLLVVASHLGDALTLKYWLTGVWYSDPFRPATLLPVAVLPVSAIGMTWVWDRLSKAARTSSVGPAGSALVPTLASLCALGLAVLDPSVSSATADISVAHRPTSSSAVLTDDELSLIREVPRWVPPGGMIAGNPMTGTALVWALADRPVVEPLPGLTRGRAGQIVQQSLRDWADDPAVCQAVRQLDVKYVLHFSGPAVDRYHAPGVDAIAGAGFELLAQRGGASLYRITGCW